MIRLFPNPTAAELHAKANPPQLSDREALIRLKVEAWGGGWALRMDLVITSEKGRHRAIRYYHEEN